MNRDRLIELLSTPDRSEAEETALAVIVGSASVCELIEVLEFLMSLAQGEEA